MNHAKVFVVTISSTLQWNCHISEVIKKANKGMFSVLILLKHAKVPTRDINSFYHTCIRPVLEYCAPLYQHALPAYLSDGLERIQKRKHPILSPGPPYVDNLTLYITSSLKDRLIGQCDKLFELVVSDSSDKLHHLLPPKNVSRYNLRKHREFTQLKTAFTQGRIPFKLTTYGTCLRMKNVHT